MSYNVFSGTFNTNMLYYTVLLLLYYYHILFVEIYYRYWCMCMRGFNVQVMLSIFFCKYIQVIRLFKLAFIYGCGSSRLVGDAHFVTV